MSAPWPEPVAASFLPPAPPVLAPAPVESAAVPPGPEWVRKFDEDLAADTAFENKLLTREMGIVLGIVLLVALREALL